MQNYDGQFKLNGQEYFYRAKDDSGSSKITRVNLSVSDEYYDKKYEDMQVRLDKLYDEIEEIEISIEAVETRLYNIK